ncbi:MAG: hypothetical protein ACXW31_16010 [Thermoanaerobaculia bacterium]
MNRRVGSTLFCFALSLFLSIPAHAEVHGVEFAPSPAPSWRCGLSNDDFQGLAAESMTQPLAAGCEQGDAKAYIVIVDLSDSRSVMHAGQMAADAEDQLPSNWKIESKSYDVITLSSGRQAAYSRLVGRGDGFTFVSGQKPMVAVSANVPLLFEDASGTQRQTIAVFRVRSPLPASAAQRKEAIAELDRTLREWAATARPASGRTITDRDFELAAYARTKGLTGTATSASAASAGTANERDRIPSALTAAFTGSATAADVAMLEETAQRFEQTALGEVARSLVVDARRAAQEREQQQILAVTLDQAKDKAGDVLSRFLVAAVEKGDAAGVAAALDAAKKRGWTLRNAGPATTTALVAAVTRSAWSPADADRAIFELSPTEILPLVRNARAIPPIEEIARPARNEWRMKRRDASGAAYLVEKDQGLGVLERQSGNGQYRFRPITNPFDRAIAHGDEASRTAE